MPAREPSPCLLLAALLLLAGCGQKAAALPEVRLALTVGALGHLPIPLAQSLGYLEQEGIRVTLAGMPGGAKVMEAMIGGSAEIGASSLEAVAQLTAEGRPMKCFLLELGGLPLPLMISPKASRNIAGIGDLRGTSVGVTAGSSDVMYDSYDYTLFRAPEGRRLRAFLITTLTPARLLAVAPGQADRIHRVEDLKGGTVGVGSFGGTFHRALEYFLERHGLTTSDIHLTVIGAGASAIAAFEHGNVDAGIINWSSYNVLKRRAPRTRALVDPRSREEKRRVFGVEDVPRQSLFAREDWLAGHVLEARAMARAILNTMHWIRRPFH